MFAAFLSNQLAPHRACVVCSVLDELKTPLAILGAIAAGAAVPTLARRALGRGGGGGGDGGGSGGGGGGGGGDGGRSGQAGQVCALSFMSIMYWGSSSIEGRQWTEQVQGAAVSIRDATAQQRASGTSHHTYS